MTRPQTFRMVSSEKAGYGPGQWVVQYHDPEAAVWFDVGDPLDHDAARARLSRLRAEAATDLVLYWNRPADQAEARRVSAAWNVVTDARDGQNGAVRYVEAEADTGTRYVVTVSRLPEGAREGGTHLVTVLWPWTDAHAMQYGDGYLAPTYVAEHLTGERVDPRSPGAPAKRVYGPEDFTALVLTVRHALDRTEG